MTGLYVSKTESLTETEKIQFRTANPFGVTSPIETQALNSSNPFENYEYQGEEASAIENKSFKGFMQAEKSYVIADFALKNSQSVTDYNIAARFANYGAVRTDHRQDL